MVYSLNDEVLARLVQILQEAILVGDDVTDLLRQVRITPSSDNETSLVLTQDYKELVARMHNKLLERAQQLQAEARAGFPQA